MEEESLMRNWSQEAVFFSLRVWRADLFETELLSFSFFREDFCDSLSRH